jgi:hypothetical protein
LSRPKILKSKWEATLSASLREMVEDGWEWFAKVSWVEEVKAPPRLAVISKSTWAELERGRVWC